MVSDGTRPRAPTSRNLFHRRETLPAPGTPSESIKQVPVSTLSPKSPGESISFPWEHLSHPARPTFCRGVSAHPPYTGPLPPFAPISGKSSPNRIASFPENGVGTPALRDLARRLPQETQIHPPCGSGSEGRHSPSHPSATPLADGAFGSRFFSYDSSRQAGNSSCRIPSRLSTRPAMKSARSSNDRGFW